MGEGKYGGGEVWQLYPLVKSTWYFLEKRRGLAGGWGVEPI